MFDYCACDLDESVMNHYIVTNRYREITQSHQRKNRMSTKIDD